MEKVATLVVAKISDKIKQDVSHAVNGVLKNGNGGWGWGRVGVGIMANIEIYC